MKKTICADLDHLLEATTSLTATTPPAILLRMAKSDAERVLLYLTPDDSSQGITIHDLMSHLERYPSESSVDNMSTKQVYDLISNMVDRGLLVFNSRSDHHFTRNNSGMDFDLAREGAFDARKQTRELAEFISTLSDVISPHHRSMGQLRRVQQLASDLADAAVALSHSFE